MDFEWLLFDFDNTLVDFHDSSVKAFKRSFDKHELSISEEAYATYKKINKKIWDKFEKGEITTDDIRKDRFSQLFEALKINHIDPIKFNASYIEDIIFYTELYPGALSLLKRLKEKYKLAIVTNGLKEAQ